MKSSASTSTTSTASTISSMHNYRITIRLRIKPVNKKKRVAILGAGPGGLVAAKYALENDIVPVVFDRKKVAGGLWSPGTAIWDGMHTNVSRYSVMFSDYPWPKDTNLIPSAKEVSRYLHNYIDHFGLGKYLRLNSNIESVKYLPNKKWQVTWTNYVTDERVTEVFDHLICSSGIHCKPIMPKMPDMESFKGLVLHSADYKSTDERIKNKRVVVIGNSFSGVEISSHLVGHARSVVNVFSRPYLVFPRLLKLPAQDATAPNMYNIVPIDLIFGRQQTHMQHRSKEEERAAKIKLYRTLCPDQTDPARALPEMYYDIDNDDPLREAVTDNYYPYIKQGKIVPRMSKVKRFTADGLELEDGTFEPADVVLFCTGYKVCLDYFEKSALDIMKYNPNNERIPIVLYKYTIHPDLENLAIIGEVAGLFFAGFELQARWAFQLFRGEKQLPPRAVMDAEMRRHELSREALRNNQYPHGVYNELCDTVAAECGALPDFEALAHEDPRLYKLIYVNGVIPSHYCFNHNRELAVAMMEEVEDVVSHQYSFSEDELANVTTKMLAEKMSQRFIMPMHLFTN